jgi:hypothetical protein
VARIKLAFSFQPNDINFAERCWQMSETESLNILYERGKLFCANRGKMTVANRTVDKIYGSCKP